jgi:hypothetical protein
MEKIVTEDRVLRFGIMCSGTVFAQWQARCLRKLLETSHARPALLILDQRPPAQRSPWWRKYRALKTSNKILWSLYVRRFVVPKSEAMKSVDLSTELADVPRLPCTVRTSGKFSEYFDPVDVQTIRAANLDFILRFGFNIIRGDILNAARYGVWSFHTGDIEKYRGGPPCFWEIYNRDSLTGSTLQRLNERLDGGVVLRRRLFPTVSHSYVENRDSGSLLGVAWPAEVCMDIVRGDGDYVDNAPTQSKAPNYRLPANRQMLVFLWRLALNRLIRRLCLIAKSAPANQ